jgi:hypothetical protein
LFTGVLSLATVRLWDSTKGLHEETKHLAELAKAQSDDMKAAMERVAENIAIRSKTGSDNPSGPEL